MILHIIFFVEMININVSCLFVPLFLLLSEERYLCPQTLYCHLYQQGENFSWQGVTSTGMVQVLLVETFDNGPEVPQVLH